MRIGLVLLLTINPQASNAGSGGLSILLLHNGLQGSPLGQLLLVTGLELAALCLITPGAHNYHNLYLSFFRLSSADCSKEECPSK